MPCTWNGPCSPDRIVRGSLPKSGASARLRPEGQAVSNNGTIRKESRRLRFIGSLFCFHATNINKSKIKHNEKKQILSLPFVFSPLPAKKRVIGSVAGFPCRNLFCTLTFSQTRLLVGRIQTFSTYASRAARSTARGSERCGLRVSSSSRSGSGTRAPVTEAMTSPNLAGWAVER